MAFPPVFEVDYNLYPNVAENIWQAQMAGAPKVLRYDGLNPKHPVRRKKRREAMNWVEDPAKVPPGEKPDAGKVPVLPEATNPAFLLGETDRDEYPFACTLEGGADPFISHVPEKENSLAGSELGSFIIDKKLQTGSPFKVVVIKCKNKTPMAQCKKKCIPCDSLCP
jgi:hypothetical protein